MTAAPSAPEVEGVKRLADLRQPPKVGSYYLVPVVRHNWCGVETAWPVLGPMHTDADILRFEDRHYHIDARFVSKSLIARAKGVWAAGSDIFSAAQQYPLSRRRGSDEEIPVGRPALARRKCHNAAFPYRHGHQGTIQALRDHYGKAEAIHLADGRKLCPHRKVDLSQFTPDDDGVVTCPLHGLHVCVRATALAGRG